MKPLANTACSTLAPLILLSACTAPGASSSSSSSSTGGRASFTTITVDQANAAVAFTRLPNGHFILVEGAARRVLETDPQGHVVAVNSTDFQDLEWPNEVTSDDTGQIYVVANHSVYTYTQTIAERRQAFLPRNGNDVLTGLIWGGTPRRLWAVQASSATAPRFQVVRFDTATANVPGTPTVVGEFDRAGYLLAVDDANNVYMSDSNACRIVKMSPGGTTSVVVGTGLGETGQCYNGGSLGRTAERVGQGRGMALDPSRSMMVFSDGSNHALIDITAVGTARADATRVLLIFPATTNTEQLVTGPDALFVLDVAAHNILHVKL